jgi:phosphonate transport system substrate-binding protein
MKKSGRRIAGGVLCAMLVLSAGCERRDERRAEQAPGQRDLLIGLIPEQNIFRQRERYQILKSYLSDHAGINVSFTSLSRYGNIIEHFTKEKLDGAFFGSFTYALAHSQLGVEPLARPVNLDGTSTYQGFLFVRKDSGIRTARDMKDKRFVFVERATTAGYLFPLAYFRDNGIPDPRAFLGESFFAGSHDAAVQAVLNREADVGAAKNTIYKQMAAANPRIENELMVLSASGAVPENCLAVRSDLEPGFKRLLKDALLDMDKNAEGKDALRRFGAIRFIETEDGDYAYLYKLSARVGIFLKTYRYENK